MLSVMVSSLPIFRIIKNSSGFLRWWSKVGIRVSPDGFLRLVLLVISVILRRWVKKRSLHFLDSRTWNIRKTDNPFRRNTRNIYGFRSRTVSRFGRLSWTCLPIGSQHCGNASSVDRGCKVLHFAGGKLTMGRNVSGGPGICEDVSRAKNGRLLAV